MPVSIECIAKSRLSDGPPNSSPASTTLVPKLHLGMETPVPATLPPILTAAVPPGLCETWPATNEVSFLANEGSSASGEDSSASGEGSLGSGEVSSVGGGSFVCDGRGLASRGRSFGGGCQRFGGCAGSFGGGWLNLAGAERSLARRAKGGVFPGERAISGGRGSMIEGGNER